MRIKPLALLLAFALGGCATSTAPPMAESTAGNTAVAIIGTPFLIEYLRSNMNFTEIAQAAGFSDSAHFTRSWQRRYGLTPSYLRDSRHLRIFD